jgi:phosphonate transport system substrate-binding protein
MRSQHNSPAPAFDARPHFGRSLRQLTAALSLVFVSSPAWAELNLVFGTYPSDKPSAMVQQLRPTLNLLEQSVGETLGDKVNIRLEVLRDYDTGVDVLTSGKIDFARLGAASYVAAKDQVPGIEILAAERFGEGKFFAGVIAVNDHGSVKTIDDLRGKNFAFGAEQSTLARYGAQLFLAKRGITAIALGSFKYLERHDRVAAAVAAGQFDAGALESTVFDQFVKSGAPLRAIATLRDATKPWVARLDLPPQIKTALTKALVGIRDPAALAALRLDGFLSSDDSDYAITRASIQENWRFFQKPPS